MRYFLSKWEENLDFSLWEIFRKWETFRKIKSLFLLTGRFLTNDCEITFKVNLAVKMYPCKCCGVVFKEKSSLLRHISHKPLCKKYYGEEKFNDLRREARLASKRSTEVHAFGKKQTKKHATITHLPLFSYLCRIWKLSG